MNTQFLTPAEVVARWGGAVTTDTLANWRSKRKGPRFTKVGARVRYRLQDVIAYEIQNTHLAPAETLVAAE